MSTAAENTQRNGSDWRVVAGQAWQSPWVRRLAFAMLAVEVVTHSVVPAFVNTYELIKTTAAADAAPLRYRSEAAIATEKLKSEIETARNAAEKMRSDAVALKYEAGIKRQKSKITLETARNAAQRQAGLADQAEAERSSKHYALDVMMASYFRSCRGHDVRARLDSAAAGRC